MFTAVMDWLKLCHFVSRVNYEAHLQSATFTALEDLAFNCGTGRLKEIKIVSAL